MGFTEFCGNSSFWSLEDVWHTEDPDFSPCFQTTALAWIPAAFLALRHNASTQAYLITGSCLF